MFELSNKGSLLLKHVLPDQNLFVQTNESNNQSFIKFEIRILKDAYKINLVENPSIKCSNFSIMGPDLW